jgi:hypothetical protein
LLVLLLPLLVVVPNASAEQSIPQGLKRVGAHENTNLNINGVDDFRVDAGIAVLDMGVDLDHPDLNVVAGIECLHTTLPGVCEADVPEAGNDIFDSHTGLPPHGHGTGLALGAAAIDNDFGSVGPASGARIYAVQELPDIFARIASGEPWEVELESTIGAMKWIEANADKVDVAFGGIQSLCSLGALPKEIGHGECTDGQKIEEFKEAAQKMVDAGVVWVMPVGNVNMNVVKFLGPSNPNVIAVSAMADWDGLPGGEAPKEACKTPSFAIYPPGEDIDDSLSNVTNWGALVDMASPSCVTSGASPPVAGAAAVLASMEDRGAYETPRDFVEAVRGKLLGDGDCAINAGDTNSNVGAGDCNWTHDPPTREGEPADSVKEPLLDLRDGEVFNPETVPGSEPAAVDSDVNGDGRAELVTLRANGVAYVHPGNGEAKFGTGVASFSDGEGGGTLDPAQYDGQGHYVIDVADAAGFRGEKRSDLITLDDGGDVHVYAGRADAKFEEEGNTSELGLTPGLLDAGGFEPIAVADVDGGGHADLIAYDDVANEVVVYRGYSEGTFGPHQVVARSSIDSALHTGSGHYFIDAADVTGDNRADLVSMHEGALKVFSGSPSATFEAPVISHSASIDPAMDDGAGYEPVGLGDVTKDGHADLALVKSGTVYLYPGSEGGGFGEAATSFAGTAPSTTFGSSGVEMLGLVDVDGNEHADIVGVFSGGNNKARVILGQSNGIFAIWSDSEGSFPSTQHFKNQTSAGNEFVSENPSWRRRGCEADGCGWVIESVPNAAAAPNNRLTDVSCTSATFCFATANLTDLGTTWAYGAVWDGSSWKGKSGVPENSGTVLSAVSCASPTSCTVVGHETEENGDVLNLAVRWDGTGWTRQEVPNAPGAPNNRLTDVSCPSATFCLATGYVTAGGTAWGYGRVWDGSTWSVAPGSIENTGVVLSAVSCASPTSCMAVGHETEENGDVLNIAAHWDGLEWTGRQEVPNAAGAPNNRLTDVSCPSAAFCFATGYLIAGGTTWGYGRGWDGSTWSKATGFIDNTSVTMSGVSCTSPTSCTVVGHETLEGGDVVSFAAHSNGTVWTARQRTPNPPEATESKLAAVSCVFPGCKAVGSYTDSSGISNLAEHSP